jgi:hypothetical protein
MTTTTRRRVAGLIFGASLIGTMPAFAKEAPPTTLMVLVNDYVTLSPDMLELARAEANRIFQDINVEIVWLERGDARFDDPFVLNSVVVVQILSPEMAKRMKGPRCMGRAVRGSRMVHVFYDGIEALARQVEGSSSARRANQTASILGHVIAHEIGHLLLPTAAHSVSGIMQARMDSKRASLGALFFTRSQGEEMRPKLLTWQRR